MTEPSEVRLDWDAFDHRLRDLLSEYGPVQGTVYEDDEPSADGLQGPFVITDWVLAAVYEDANGDVFTSHLQPSDALRYRIRGLVDMLTERV